VAFHAIPQGVSWKSEAGRSTGDVPSFAAKRLLNPRAFQRRHLLVDAFASTRDARGGDRRSWQTQGGCSDPLRIGQHGHPFHQIGQLAHVARPRITLQGGFRVSSEDLSGNAVLAARSVQIVVCQEQDVGSTLTKRRQLHGDDSKAMVQVLAKPPSANRCCKILARRCKHPGIGRFDARAPEPPSPNDLRGFEQLGLQSLGHQADLVEKRSSAMAICNSPALACLASVNAPRSKPKSSLRATCRESPRS
jgi:hypothetical protein